MITSWLQVGRVELGQRQRTPLSQGCCENSAGMRNGERGAARQSPLPPQRRLSQQSAGVLLSALHWPTH